VNDVFANNGEPLNLDARDGGDATLDGFSEFRGVTSIRMVQNADRRHAYSPSHMSASRCSSPMPVDARRSDLASFPGALILLLFTRRTGPSRIDIGPSMIRRRTRSPRSMALVAGARKPAYWWSEANRVQWSRGATVTLNAFESGSVALQAHTARARLAERQSPAEQADHETRRT
jgi:hypothetical protein